MVVPEPVLLLLPAKAESPAIATKVISAPIVTKILSLVMMYSIIRIFQTDFPVRFLIQAGRAPSRHCGIRSGLLPCFRPGLSLLIVGFLRTRFYVTGVPGGHVTYVFRRGPLLNH